MFQNINTEKQQVNKVKDTGSKANKEISKTLDDIDSIIEKEFMGNQDNSREVSHIFSN